MIIQDTVITSEIRERKSVNKITTSYTFNYTHVSICLFYACHLHIDLIRENVVNLYFLKIVYFPI